MEIVAWAVLGLAIAAALNHLADRLPSHRALWPPPACPECGAPYAWYQWLALPTWLARRRRCRKCSAPIALRRLIFELWLAFFFAALAWRHGLSWALVAASFHASVLSLVAVTDLETRIVPNAAVLPASAISIAAAALTSLPSTPDVLIGGAIALGIFLLLWLINPGGIGFGDVKLAGYIGLVAGYPRVFPCLLVGILAGGVTALVLLLARRVSRRSYIPYAPFLALGGALALFLR